MEKLTMCDEEKVMEIVNRELFPLMSDVKTKITVLTLDLEHFMQTQTTVTQETRSEVSGIRKTLYGNGDPDNIGLRAEVSKIKDWVNSRVWFERLVIGGLVIEILGMIVLAINTILAH